LIWHYTVDASLVGLLLVRSNSLYFKVSGVVVGLAAAAPLLFAAISYLSRGRFEADEDLLNQSAPAAEISLAPAREEVATESFAAQIRSAVFANAGVLSGVRGGVRGAWRSDRL